MDTQWVFLGFLTGWSSSKGSPLVASAPGGKRRGLCAPTKQKSMRVCVDTHQICRAAPRLGEWDRDSGMFRSFLTGRCLDFGGILGRQEPEVGEMFSSRICSTAGEPGSGNRGAPLLQLAAKPALPLAHGGAEGSRREMSTATPQRPARVVRARSQST